MKRVLIVDDSALVIAQLTDMLVFLGYAVAGSASSGAQAVDQARLLNPDIILMDIVMPGEMDGIDAADPIRDELDIPIIFMTAYEDEKSIDRIKEAQAHGYLLKPIRPLDLKASIEIALQKKESEARLADLYREVVEKTSDLIYVLDVKGNLKFANDQIIRMGGYPREELIGRNFASFLTPDSVAHVVDMFGRRLKGEDVGPFEVELLDSSGGLHVVEVRERLVWKDGRVVEIHGIGRDVTERKKAEEALRRSEQRYRIITDNMEESVWVLDKDFKPVYVSPLATRGRGYTFEEIQALPLKENMTPESFDRIVKVVIDLLNKKKAGHAESRISDVLDLEWTRKDGTRYWTEVALTLIFDEKGELSEVLGVGRDITERRKAEEALRESEAKFRGVFETSRDLMYISSLDGTIIDYNAFARELFGYTDEEMRSITMADLYYNPQDRDRLVERLTAEGFVENYELRLKKKDGSSMDALANATVRKDAGGTIVGFQGAIKDITQIKRMEQYLLQTEKLSGLGTMISGVAHELNNPLTGIMGAAELLLMDRNLPEKAKKPLKAILTESERAAAIIAGLLSFAREHKPGRKTVDINNVITEAYRLRQYNFKTSGITVNLSLAESLPPTSADPHQLHQVFTNIINNAYDALMEKGGGTLTISSAEENGSLVVAFEDDGPGIEEENLKKIFDPFFTTKDVGKGTGLGLSMAYGIIKEHGGEIEVRSRKGTGATFLVTIPVSSGAGEQGGEIEERPPIQEAVHAGKRILVVDDEKHVRDTLCEALSRVGYVVERAGSGQEALRLIEHTKFDAVVADIKMPEMDGRELYGYVLNKYSDISERFIFITGDILGEETQVFLNVSECRYIAKPFRMDELLALLDQVLGG